MAPSSTITVSLIPLDFGEKGVYASYTLTLTKMDEACSLGGLISVLSRHRLLVAFSTNGQKVPEDIYIGRPHTLVSRAVELSRRNDGEEISEDLLAMRLGGAREHAHV